MFLSLFTILFLLDSSQTAMHAFLDSGLSYCLFVELSQFLQLHADFHV